LRTFYSQHYGNRLVCEVCIACGCVTRVNYGPNIICSVITTDENVRLRSSWTFNTN